MSSKLVHVTRITFQNSKVAFLQHVATTTEEYGIRIMQEFILKKQSAKENWWAKTVATNKIGL